MSLKTASWSSLAFLLTVVVASLAASKEDVQAPVVADKVQAEEMHYRRGQEYATDGYDKKAGSMSTEA